jgi:hypothetical protein
MTTQYTKEEMQQMFIDKMHSTADYWSALPVDPGETMTTAIQRRVSGVVFSVLVVLDGGSADLPGFSVIPQPHETDKDYQIAEGERYWSPALEDSVNENDLAGGLHELYSKERATFNQ